MLGERVLGQFNDLAHIRILVTGLLQLLLTQVLLGWRIQLLVNEIRNGRQIPCALELDGLLLAQLEEAQRRIAGHLMVGAQRLVLGAVHLGNGHLRIIDVHDLSQLLPQRVQTLAMATPVRKVD